jgi:DNA repair exonuclease SbcCD ATPase subunit
MQLSPADRRSIIEDLLDIQIFSSMNTIVKNRISTIKDEQKTVEYDTKLINEKISFQKQNIEDHKKNHLVEIEKKTKEITDKLVVTIVDPQTKKEEKTNTGGSVPNIDPVWVRKPEWEEHEFNAKTVGKVIVTQEKTIIFVNRDYFRLDKALSINGLTERQIDMRAERYIVPVAVALYMQDLDMKALPDSENRPSDEFLIRSNDYMAEAVLAAMHSDIEVAGEMERDA